jgi:ElaB/YqjD/DUF883 family membrane-anchored ribosome-binding protein
VVIYKTDRALQLVANAGGEMVVAVRARVQQLLELAQKRAGNPEWPSMRGICTPIWEADNSVNDGRWKIPCVAAHFGVAPGVVIGMLVKPRARCEIHAH